MAIALLLIAGAILPTLPALSEDVPAPAGDSSGGCGEPRYAPWWDATWGFRKMITINNTNNPSTLSGYPVIVNISYNSHMNTDFSDLRFTQYNSSLACDNVLSYWIMERVNGSSASVMVRPDQISGSASTATYMYYGNAGAQSMSNTSGMFDSCSGFDTDLEGWKYSGPLSYSIMWNDWEGNPAPSAMIAGDVVAWVGPNYAFMEKTVNKNIGDGLAVTVDYRASSHTTDVPATNAGLWVTDTSNRPLYNSSYVSGGVLDTGWVQNQRKTVVNEIQNYTQVKLRFGLDDSWTRDYGQSNWYDNVRISRYTSPEPACTVGVEERPFSFRSMSHGPARLNVGDTVFFNATFNNPGPESIDITLAAREADRFNDTTAYFYSGNVTLAPFGDTMFPFSWTAVGGQRTIWLALHDAPLAWAKLHVNRDPAIAPIKDQSLLQGRQFVLRLNASDPDGDQLSWSMDNPLFELTRVSDCSAEMSILPTNDDVGIHRANITVRDTMNRSDTKAVNLTVNNVNDPPVLSNIPSLSATQYKELRYNASASDPDLKWGDALKFSDDSDIFEIDAITGCFSFLPLEEHVGRHCVNVTVTDMGGLFQTDAFTITVANVNDPPAFDELPPLFAIQGRPFQLTLEATDPDLESCSTEKLSYSDDSPLFNINPQSGMIGFSPTNDQIGEWRANITVTDRGGLSNTTQLTITVLNANDPPSIEAIPAQTATEGASFFLQVNATDPDLEWGLDNLTFSDDTDMFNIDPMTGVISFTPSGAQLGLKRVTITVKDEVGASASASIGITILHVNHPPYGVTIRYPADGANLKVGDDMWLDGTAKDSDKGDILRYSWSDNGKPVGTGKNISIELKPGTHAIELEVSDGSETVSTGITVQVEKKTAVTAGGGGDSKIPLVAAVSAVFTIVAVVAALATMRKKRQNKPEPSGGGRAALVPEGEDVAPALPAPKRTTLKTKHIRR